MIWLLALSELKLVWVLIVAALGLGSGIVAVFWSGLFYRPASRIADWIALLILYGIAMGTLQSRLSPDADAFVRVPWMIAGLVTILWGAAWAWRYVNIFEAENIAVRIGLTISGILFVLSAPCVFGFVALAANEYFVNHKSTFAIAGLWMSAYFSIGLLPGIIISRIAKAALAIKEQRITTGRTQSGAYL